MIYISNDNESLDAKVGIEIKLPCLPRIKDELFLTDEQISELEEMAKSDLKIAENYFPYIIEMYNSYQLISCIDYTKNNLICIRN